MTHRETLINAVVEHLSNVGKELFGIKVGTASKALIKVVAGNFLDNSPYGAYVDALFDKEGNFLTTGSVYFEALKEFASQKPVEIMGLKFNHKDVADIEEIFNSLS